MVSDVILMWHGPYLIISNDEIHQRFQELICEKVAWGLPGPPGLSPVMLRASFLIFGSIFVHPFASYRHRYSFLWLLSRWARRLLLPVFPEKDHLHLTDSGLAVWLCLKVNISNETEQKKEPKMYSQYVQTVGAPHVFRKK